MNPLSHNGTVARQLQNITKGELEDGKIKTVSADLGNILRVITKNILQVLQ